MTPGLICRMLFLVAGITLATNAYADDPYGASRSNVGGGRSFNNSAPHNFNSHRSNLNGQYIRITRDTWRQLRGAAPEPQPVDTNPPVPPVVIDDNSAAVPRNDRRVPVRRVITPRPPQPQPQPVIIPEQDNSSPTNYHNFTFFGTNEKVRLPEQYLFPLPGTSENDVADAWQTLCNGSFDNTVADCLSIRERHTLDDWAYLLMLDQLGKSIYGNNSDRATVFTTYVYSQSGYRTRMARNPSGRLALLYASQHRIFDKGYFRMDGDRFYPLDSSIGNELYVCQAAYPGEKSLSLAFRNAPGFDYAPSPQRTLKSRRYPDMKIELTTNANVMPFFETYPSSTIDNNMMSRWAMYANTPIQEPTRRQLYSALSSHIDTSDKLQSAEKLLNWVQTAFVYGYDNQIWGHDRAFFADETLYYPYCDCEDRSILFSRLVRDLLNLPVVLVYYPGHLATAVAFDTPVTGDYIEVNGRRFTVCDPTYIGAKVGATMPNMDNASAEVILLKNR